MKTILAPIDFSAVSDHVVAEAARLARALPARVVLFNVVPPATPPFEYPALALIAEATRANEKAAIAGLEKMTRRLNGEFIHVESSHVVGTPALEIAARAKEVDADYIVMGSHGHTAVYDLLVGSTTHGVLSRVRCPVIIVPAAKMSLARKRKAGTRETAATR